MFLGSPASKTLFSTTCLTEEKTFLIEPLVSKYLMPASSSEIFFFPGVSEKRLKKEYDSKQTSNQPTKLAS
jgi:hypothetical protein